MDKRRILEIYLNVIEWGDGVFGAEAAARHYYGASAASLGPEAAARLAAMVPNPRFYDRNRNTAWLARKTADDPRAHARGGAAVIDAAANPPRRHAAGAPRGGRAPARATSAWSRTSRTARASTTRKPALVDEPGPQAELRELQKRLDDLHPADVAYVLEGLPLEDRLLVWGLVRSDRDGEILLEVSDAVRDTLLADMDSAEIVAATQNLDADEIADLAPDLPEEVVQDIIEAQDVEDRAELQTALSYPEGTVGALMDFEVVSIREDVDLRGGAALPAPLRRAAAPDRRGLRGRPRRPPEGRAAAEHAAGHRSRRRGRRALRPRGGLVRARRTTPTRRRRRSTATTWCARRWSTPQRQGDRPRHRRRGARVRARAPGAAGARQGGPARGGGHLLERLGEREEPRAVARAEPLHRVRRLARGGRLRGLDREARRARRADADRGRHRRQLRQPDHHAHRARARARAR